MIDLSILGEQLVNGLVLGAIYGLIAIGYSLVYGIIGMINFAHGDVYMISAYLTAIGIAVCGLLGLPSLALTIGLTALFVLTITSIYGYAIERIAYRPLRNASRLAPLISAIGISIVLENFVRLTQSARSQAIPVLFEDRLKIPFGQHVINITLIELCIIIFSLISMIVLTLVIKKTRLGRMMRATQLDLNMAQILGVNPNKIIPFVFILGAFMAASTGILVTLHYGSFDFSIGFMVGIKAFTAAVLGGIGSLSGAMLGGLLLGLSESLFSGFISADYKDVFAFSVLILVLIFKPNGLLGTHDVEKI